jgi:membrane associated rhomboid family serine protease
MGLPYWVFPHDGNFHLLVETESLGEVAREVALYDDEPPLRAPADDPQSHASDTTLYLCYAYTIVLGAAFLLQKSQEPWSVNTFGNDTLAVFQSGEWWRTATALALHSDLGHLFGNMIFGVWFGVLAARALGPWIAALGFLVSGMLGNALSAWIYFPNHTVAIGASTAVFGALGLLVGNGLHTSLRNHSLSNLSSKLAPLAGGLALLGLMGAGDIQTDILAHCCGFLAGIPLGFAATYLTGFTQERR